MLLKIRDLKIEYSSDKDIEVIRGLDLDIKKGECVGLVGESGCGKTTVGLSITRLIPERAGKIRSGSILFEGRDILGLNKDELRSIRGKKISYVFQEPFSSLNPVFTIYDQLKEAVPLHLDTKGYIDSLLESVGLSELCGKKNIYPHELSGGMQQRIAIAMAIASKPDLLVLDEPTTALDVTVQKKIILLIKQLKEKMDLSVLFISHDLGIIFNLADTINVMYGGMIIEKGSREDILQRPNHPYTKALLNSIPGLGHRKKRFDAIVGKGPLFSDLPKGCKFYPRCKSRIDSCRLSEPGLIEVSIGHFSRCIRWKEDI
ncbi:MAG: ABC transporter ATP-binding protein [Candidatus Omnitrophota bacterium]